MDVVDFFNLIKNNEKLRELSQMCVAKLYDSNVFNIVTVRIFWLTILNQMALELLNKKYNNSSASQGEVFNLLHFLNYFLSFSRAEMERYFVSIPQTEENIRKQAVLNGMDLFLNSKVNT